MGSFVFDFIFEIVTNVEMAYHNYRDPSLGLATKAKGLARVRAKTKSGSRILMPRECKRV